MSAWLTLLYKEYRMIRTSLLIQLGVIIIGCLWVVYLSQRYHPGLIIAPVSLLLFIALFYPALFMLKNVSWELKHTTHLWLHCPQPAWMLLSAKLGIGLACTAVTLLLGAVFIYWVLFSSYPAELAGIEIWTAASFITEAGVYVALFVFAAGIYLASWAALLAVLSAVARQFLGRFHWLAALAAFFAATWGIGRLKETWLYEKITHWGAINIKLQSLKDEALAGLQIPHFPLYTGEVVFYLVLTAALFALSAWLINNRVEV
ncbi:MAG: hypothetical protein K6T65_12155 [Peptococcaceae bacterium]|nr:hypothetical protein [Peptococcaceae bacterium]